MEIEITKFFKEAAPMDYSASVAEIGDNAGQATWQATWQAACEDAPDYNFLNTDDKRQEFRDYVEDFGAWDSGEIAAWSDVELNALFIQMVAGDIREADLDQENPDWAQYGQDASDGRISGRMFPTDDGKVYYYIGS